MGKVLVNESTLTSIADAIREKRGITSTIKPAEMPAEIKSIIADGVDFKSLVDGTITQLTLGEEVATDGVLSLRQYAFANLDKLKSLTIDEGITEIKMTEWHDIDTPFFATGWDSRCAITLPSSLEYIGDYVFSNMVFRGSLVLPEGLKSIGTSSFDCDRLSTSVGVSDIVIPASVETIGDRAFYDVSYSNVYFKGTPNSIGSMAFYHRADPQVDGTYRTRYIYVPWSKGQGPTISGLNNYTEIVYDYVYDEEV